MQAQEIEKLFVGTWRLIHSIQVKASGEREYLFGLNPVGYIYYSETGVMAVQIGRQSRKPVSDLASLQRDYFAYFGRFEIDTERNVVRHFIEGACFPEILQEILERHYRFEGNLMFLTPTDDSRHEILWQKVEAKQAFSQTDDEGRMTCPKPAPTQQKVS